MKRLGMLFIAVLMLAGCTQNMTQSNAFQYKGSFVGDNNAVIGITQNLPLHDSYQSIELQTKKRPYGVTVRYNDPGLDVQEQERLAIRNAAAYFTLLDNAEIVRFAFPNRTYAFSRPEMEAWFETDFSTIEWEKDLNDRLNEKMNDANEATPYFKQV